jgi:hypothetical protein
MKILNTVTYTGHSPYHNARMQLTASFIRARKLTHTGAQRMIRSGADNNAPSPTACVTRIETVCMQ